MTNLFHDLSKEIFSDFPVFTGDNWVTYGVYSLFSFYKEDGDFYFTIDNVVTTNMDLSEKHYGDKFLNHPCFSLYGSTEHHERSIKIDFAHPNSIDCCKELIRFYCSIIREMEYKELE